MLYIELSSEIFLKNYSVGRKTQVGMYDMLRWVGLGCRFKGDCPLVGPEPKGGVPSVGIFLRDPSPYLREFRGKPRKTPNG